MDANILKDRFLSLCAKVNRKGMDNLIRYLEASDFFTAPASARLHCSFPGGLLLHSLNVYDEFVRLLEAYKDVVTVTEESAIIMCLFHDLCKANTYAPEKRNRKNEEGKWETYDAYTRKEKFCFGGHGSKSVFILQSYIPLTAVEAVAINCHMSCWDGNKDVGEAFEQYPEAWLLHVADEAATYIREADQ